MSAKKTVLKAVKFPPVILFLSLLVVFLIVSGYSALFPPEIPEEPPNLRIIEIYGDIQEDGGWQPVNITINKSEEVIIRVYANDTVHGLGIPDLGLETGSILPGAFEDLKVKIDEPGVYEFECIVFCSPEHPNMKGHIIVEVGE